MSIPSAIFLCIRRAHPSPRSIFEYAPVEKICLSACPPTRTNLPKTRRNRRNRGNHRTATVHSRYRAGLSSFWHDSSRICICPVDRARGRAGRPSSWNSSTNLSRISHRNKLIPLCILTDTTDGTAALRIGSRNSDGFRTCAVGRVLADANQVSVSYVCGGVLLGASRAQEKRQTREKIRERKLSIRLLYCNLLNRQQSRLY